MIRGRTLLLLAALGAAVAACGRSGVLAFEESGGGGPFPDPVWRDPAATSTGTPATPTPTPAFGDGSDGALVVAGTLVVNTCHTVVLATGMTATFGTPPSGIGPGKLLLFHQVQESFATAGDVADVVAAGRAGAHELVRAVQVNGTVVEVDAPLGRFESMAGIRRAQACTVPQYTTLTIPNGAQITGPAWNGTRGGLVAFYASVSVEIEGDVIADGQGFRGGTQSTSSTTQNFDAMESANGTDGGGKGEGLDIRSFGRWARGNYANGAGGGNAHNAGGGGGGNGGAGGLGGREYAQDGPDATSPGIGGARVLLGDVLVFGGGGGGGHHNGDGGTHEGGTGGGAVLIVAPVLTGNGAIRANATRGMPTTGVNDGGGGGAAGGTIELRITDPTGFDGDVEALGGDGGEAQDVFGDHGPGGGGGGGLLRLQGDFDNATLAVDEGSRGASSGSSHFSQDGQPGRIETIP